MLKLYNTLTRKIEEFEAIYPHQVNMYSCGPTVYDYQHIGHMRRYVGDDILVRVLKANGYNVSHVMNITDVGHLVSDSDTGEDKMEKGAKKFGKSVWEVARMFEEQFWNSTDALNIKRPTTVMRATDYIKEQIDLVKKLEEKGYTYKTADGIYFDTAKFPDYFKLSRQNPDELQAGARVDMGEKRKVSDFALWKFSPQNEKRQMEWESPWGIGFPGWHIECSAMSLEGLFHVFENGSLNIEKVKTLDIHTGGIDHIAIHHTNEIAQAECATGNKFVNFWVHHNFLVVESTKMSKSLGNFYTVQDIIVGNGLPDDRQGYNPLSLRYLYLQTHYRQEMNFTWEALEAAETSLKKLRLNVDVLGINQQETTPDLGFMKKFMEALNDDLNTSKALSVLWNVVKSDLSLGEKRATILEMDKILGLSLDKKEIVEISQEVLDLVASREDFRKAGDFGASDELRKKIEDLGFLIKDTKEGPQVTSKKDK